jgi:hypothetical protein
MLSGKGVITIEKIEIIYPELWTTTD